DHELIEPLVQQPGDVARVALDPIAEQLACERVAEPELQPRRPLHEHGSDHSGSRVGGKIDENRSTHRQRVGQTERDKSYGSAGDYEYTKCLERSVPMQAV